MSDLIKREDAIEACDALPKLYGEAIKIFIKRLPSADRPQEDTVSRRYLLAEIDDLADEFSEVDENGLHGERWCGILDSRGIIVNAPSVEDRPQGEWKRRLVDSGFNADWVCSECGYRVKTDFVSFNYCPNCGCHMKGSDDE